MTTQKRNPLDPKLVVRDAAGAIAFYAEVLGAVELERMEAGGRIVHSVLAIDGATFGVIDQAPESGNVAPGDDPPAVILQLEASDPDAIAKAVQARGGEILFPPADRPYGRRDTRLRDPFGHVWIVGRPV